MPELQCKGQCDTRTALSGLERENRETVVTKMYDYSIGGSKRPSLLGYGACPQRNRYATRLQLLLGE